MVFLLSMAAGCDSAESLVPVRGKVSYQGTPLHTGIIVFTPDALRGTTGSLARGEIQPDGAYTLHTGDALGVTVGRHRVTIVALDPTPAVASGQSSLIPRSLLPDKYRDPDLSGLTCDVQPGRENSIDFNLD
jgi:hypothetical protein